MFIKKLLESCQPSPEVDPYLAAPVIHGGDYESFDRQMTKWHQAFSEAMECEVRPVRRADEPAVTITATWGDFVKDAKSASRLSAMEAIDQIAAMRKPRN